MRAPLSWLRQYAALPDDLNAGSLAAALIRAGLEVETVDRVGADLRGLIVVGRILSYQVEEHSNGKKIRYCRVDVGQHNDPSGSRGIVCGAHNFQVGDFVVVALPGATLPAGFEIGARKTYGHVSDGMICSDRELGLGDDHSGILRLTGDDLVPGTDAVPVLLLRDDVMDIAVTPDRGYCLSIRGLARRVQLAGMRSISLPVDITNYVMLETGQPIHAYDADLLDGPIVVRKANEGEKLTTLDDVVRPLHPDDQLITDGSGPIGLAGVMGGASTELSGSTVNVVIEAAHFDAMTVARTSRRHKLSSEASRRFERGVDPAATYAAAHRVAELLVDLAGGTLITEETVQGSVPAPVSTTLAGTLPAEILGTDVDRDTVVGLLHAIGARVESVDGRLTINPPTWRPDLTDPYDYVEEVGRLIGFDTIEPVAPHAPVGRGLSRSQRARRGVAAALATSGFVEVLSFPFLSIDELDRLGVPAD